jgi:hypothetical protein
LNAGLPDGFCTLFAPPDMLPAPVLIPLLVELPVVVPGLVVPLVPLVADPPTPGEPVPVCARANELANVSAAANPRVTNFMMGFLSGDKGKRQRQANVPALTSIGCDGRRRGSA